MAENSLTTPQPDPVKNEKPAVWGLVIEDMKARDDFGRKKYGTPLQAGNGRDPLTDAYQESLDLCVYLRQAIEERKPTGPGFADVYTPDLKVKLGHYQVWTGTVAIYPEAGRGTEGARTYVALGLAGEAGEIANKTKKVVRDGLATKDMAQHIAGEIGDLVWYMARACVESGWNLGYFAEALSNTDMKHYGIMQGALDVVRESSEVSDLLMQKPAPACSSSTLDGPFKRLCVVVCYLVRAWDLELKGILKENERKLTSRKERGVLGGSGDKR